MKKVFLIAFVLVAVLLSSCKFDQTPVGYFKGTYGYFGPPGTATVTEASKGSCNFKFTSVGNPDVNFYDIEMIRPTGFSTAFEGSHPIFGSFYIRMEDGFLSVTCKDTVPNPDVEFSFDGFKQN